ncbi:hypothetical protein [Pelagicoccus mobilis]|uniref:Right handed beta helix domain-containing protein n=1 Tax=Pelagicoccus mobilis TaxID=415221 RepID=A0A934RTT9_9BACT|nr:hypothetical protein [Pelagicoccus mobilis]MBK1876266.1 hypothetical protein [Pelagicoccus mobilis]
MRLITALLACTLTVSASHAATHTVDNANPGAADFDTLSAAITAAAAGDTLILAGSSTSYGSVTLNKELHLIGPGWFIEGNFPDASETHGAIIDKVTINSLAGSGSSLTSLQIGVVDLDDTSDILVQRLGPTYSTGTVFINVNDVTNSTIRQNYRAQVSGGTLSNTNSNLKIHNNILIGSGLHTTLHNSDVSYNLLRGYLIAIEGGTLRYNILAPDTSCQLTLTNALAEYNIVDASQNNTGNDKNVWPEDKNINDADETTFFAGGSFDARYKLAPGSEAANILDTGIDAGPFSGDHPYVPSGMPSVPVVFQVSAPPTLEVGQTFKLSFKATAEPTIEEEGGTDDVPLDL